MAQAQTYNHFDDMMQVINDFDTPADYWSSHNPNSEPTPTETTVWTNHPAKSAVAFQNRSVRVYQNWNNNPDGWMSHDLINWA